MHRYWQNAPDATVIQTIYTTLRYSLYDSTYFISPIFPFKLAGCTTCSHLPRFCWHHPHKLQLRHTIENSSAPAGPVVPCASYIGQPSCCYPPDSCFPLSLGCDLQTRRDLPESRFRSFFFSVSPGPVPFGLHQQLLRQLGHATLTQPLLATDPQTAALSLRHPHRPLRDPVYWLAFPPRIAI